MVSLAKKLAKSWPRLALAQAGFQNDSQQVTKFNLNVELNQKKPKKVQTASNTYDALWMRPYLQRNQQNQPNIGADFTPAPQFNTNGLVSFEILENQNQVRTSCHEVHEPPSFYL